MVNGVSFLCLLCGISNIQRRLGMRIALCAMPFVIGVMVLAFDVAPTLSVLFWIMVAAKAINYALNSPSLKQLYIPTSLDAKYKSQAWIEMFGARGAKAGGSGFNTLLGVFRAGAASPAVGLAMYIMFASAFSGVLLVGWFFAARFLAGEYDRRVAAATCSSRRTRA
jgi:ATP:ADP antiporter, AAA family